MQKRIITGVVGIAMAAALIQLGGYPFVIAVGVLMLLTWHEYVTAFAGIGENLAELTGRVALTTLMLAPMSVARDGNPWLLMGVTVIYVYALLAQMVFQHGKLRLSEAAYSVVGVVYIGLGFAHFILLRELSPDVVRIVSVFGLPVTLTLGTQYLWLGLIGTWASDTFGYFVGVSFGKHRLCERVSPKKSVEGFAGSIIGATLAVTAAGAWFGMAVWQMAILGGCIALLATLGDLVESAFKRYLGIKDSGQLIPGHGGVWDRFDSALFVMPFVYYFALG